MNEARVTLELKAIQRRTRRCLIASTIVHALLLTCLAGVKVVSPGAETLTEITWLESDEIESIIAEATAAYQPPPMAPEPVKKHFEREDTPGDVAPATQDLGAFEDKVSERLAVLQKSARRSSSMAALETQLPTRRPTLAGVSGTSTSGRPQDLVRAQAPLPTPVKLERAAPRVQKAAIAMPATPQPASEPARQTEVVTRKVLAGISMSGPVADRPLLSYQKPAYPEWAKREAIEGSVNLYFVVQPDGTVKTNVMVQKTSGFEDFDRNATDALLAWRFEPLANGATGEQWGTITFHYRLSHGDS
jgi:TonB family protein